MAMEQNHHRPSHELVHLDKLTIDPRVQRREGVNHSRVRQMITKFNPGALGALTLSRRDTGALVIIDGAHRAATCHGAGFNEPLHALVYDGLTLAQEAAMFNLLNTFKQPSFISRMLSDVVAGNREATEIVNTIESYDWVISSSPDRGCFAALAAAERVYLTGAGTLPKGRHLQVLSTTVGLITGTWNRDKESAHQMMVQGVGQIVARYGRDVDLTSFITSLEKERPQVLMGKAKALQAAQGGSTPAALAKVIVGTYNKRRRSGALPEWAWTR